MIFLDIKSIWIVFELVRGVFYGHVQILLWSVSHVIDITELVLFVRAGDALLPGIMLSLVIVDFVHYVIVKCIRIHDFLPQKLLLYSYFYLISNLNTFTNFVKQWDKSG